MNRYDMNRYDMNTYDSGTYDDMIPRYVTEHCVYCIKYVVWL